MADDVEFGHVVDLTLGEPSGTELVADAAIGATSLSVDYAGDFEDAGEVVLNGVVLPYTEIAYGDAETDPDVITLAAPLAAAAATDDKVVRVSGGEQVTDWLLHVSLGDGHPVDIPIPFEQRAMWSSVDTSTPVPVLVSSDLERLVEVPGRVPVIDGASIDASTLDTSAMPPIPTTDGDAPTAATTVTSIGGIGSMYYRWTEITNNDPVTYRLHVRAGSAPTTTGTYEVAAGVGLTSASVRKLADGTAIVGDGSVTYHAIVTVEDADGPGPASTDVSGVPAQITSPDIATGAVTTDSLVFNSGWGAELNGETINGVTITGADITGTSTVTGALVRTAATGERVEMTQADAGSVSFYSPHVDAAPTSPNRVWTDTSSGFVSGGVTHDEQALVLVSGKWTGFGAVAAITLKTHKSGPTGSPSTAADSRIQIVSDNNDFTGPTTFFNGVAATMLDGSVGTGTFRDSVDARVSAVAPTVTMTTGAVGTGTFRDSVDARADARIAAKVKGGTVTAAVAGGSGVATFTHGLGYTPSVLVPVLTSPASVREVRKVSHNATTFDVQFRDSAGTVTANGTSVTVEFIAIP